jgi:hypothetical protein
VTNGTGDRQETTSLCWKSRPSWLICSKEATAVT